MDKSVSPILCGCRPTEMTSIDAAKVASAARMRGLVNRGGRRAMGLCADKAMNEHLPVRTAHLAIAVTILSKRPRKAFIAFIGEDNFAKISLWFAFWSSAREWVSVALPAKKVHIAPATATVRLVAIWNRAYSGSSHFSLHKGCLVRARRGGDTPGGFAFIARNQQKIKGNSVGARNLCAAICCVLAVAGCTTDAALKKAATDKGTAQARVRLPPLPDDCRALEPHAVASLGDEARSVLKAERHQLDKANARVGRCAKHYDSTAKALK